MNDLFELIAMGDAQEISDRICKSVSDPDTRYRVLRAMYVMPMMFDERSKVSSIVQAHLAAAMPEEIWSRWEWGYWYKVAPIAKYVLKLPDLKHPYIPNVTIGTGDTAGTQARPFVIPRRRRGVPPPLPKITFEYDCEETGYFYERQDYEKKMDWNGEATDFDADTLNDMASDDLMDADEDVIREGQRDDYQTDDRVIAFRHVKYFNTEGDVFLIEDGDRLDAEEIEAFIGEIEDGDHADWIQ